MADSRRLLVGLIDDLLGVAREAAGEIGSLGRLVASLSYLDLDKAQCAAVYLVDRGLLGHADRLTKNVAQLKQNANEAFRGPFVSEPTPEDRKQERRSLETLHSRADALLRFLNDLKSLVDEDDDEVATESTPADESGSEDQDGTQDELRSGAKFLWKVPMLEGYVFDLLKEIEFPTERVAAEWIAAKSSKPEPSRSTMRQTFAWKTRPQKTSKPRTTNEAQSGVSPDKNADAAVSHEELTDAVLDIEGKIHRQLVDDERAAVAWTLQQAGADKKDRDDAIDQLTQGFRSGDM